MTTWQEEGFAPKRSRFFSSGPLALAVPLACLRTTRAGWKSLSVSGSSRGKSVLPFLKIFANVNQKTGPVTQSFQKAYLTI